MASSQPRRRASPAARRCPPQPRADPRRGARGVRGRPAATCRCPTSPAPPASASGRSTGTSPRRRTSSARSSGTRSRRASRPPARRWRATTRWEAIEWLVHESAAKMARSRGLRDAMSVIDFGDENPWNSDEARQLCRCGARPRARRRGDPRRPHRGRLAGADVRPLRRDRHRSRPRPPGGLPPERHPQSLGAARVPRDPRSAARPGSRRRARRAAGGGRRIGGRSPSTRSGGRDERDAVAVVGRLEAELGGERERLVDAVDRPDRDAGGAQHARPSASAGSRAEDGLEPLAERVDVRHARGVGGEALVGRQLGQADAPRTGARTAGRCRPRPRTGGRRPRRSRTGRCSGGGCRGARAARRRAPSAEPWLSSEVERRVHQRDLDVAAAAGALALDQRGLDAGRPRAARTRGRPARRRPSAAGPSASPVTLISPPIACSRKS